MQNRHPVAIAFGTIATIIVIAMIVVGGYQLHWWLRKNAVNRNSKINRQSYEVQQTYHEKALDDIAQVRAVDAQLAEQGLTADLRAQLRAQKVAIITQTCDAISRLTISGAGIDPDIQTFHDQECA